MQIICSLKTLFTLASAAFAIGILAGVSVSGPTDQPSTSDVVDHRLASGQE